MIINIPPMPSFEEPEPLLPTPEKLFSSANDAGDSLTAAEAAPVSAGVSFGESSLVEAEESLTSNQVIDTVWNDKGKKGPAEIGSVLASNFVAACVKDIMGHMDKHIAFVATEIDNRVNILTNERIAIKKRELEEEGKNAH